MDAQVRRAKEAPQRRVAAAPQTARCPALALKCIFRRPSPLFPAADAADSDTTLALPMLTRSSLAELERWKREGRLDKTEVRAHGMRSRSPASRILTCLRVAAAKHDVLRAGKSSLMPR